MLRALGLSTAEADSAICFSFGRFTTGEEVRKAARLVNETLESLYLNRTSAALRYEPDRELLKRRFAPSQPCVICRLGPRGLGHYAYNSH